MFTDDLKTAVLNDETIEFEQYEGETLYNCDVAGIKADHVIFSDCRLFGCDFSGCSFYNVKFVRCRFDGCVFGDAYFKDTEIRESKADGTVFENAVFKSCLFADTSLRYASFSGAKWQNVTIDNCCCAEGVFSSMELKRIVLKDVDFTKTVFFKTPLKGVDFSSCQLGGITVSDSLSELYGAKISSFQAADIVSLLGVEFV